MTRFDCLGYKITRLSKIFTQEYSERLAALPESVGYRHDQSPPVEVLRELSTCSSSLATSFMPSSYAVALLHMMKNPTPNFCSKEMNE